MEEIVFRVKDNKLNIIVDPQLKNREFLALLKERLEKLVVLKNSLTKDVVLDIKQRKLDNREILELFDILNDYELFYISKIICESRTKESLAIYKGNFRGGQVRFFDSSVLIIGCINKGSKVIVNGNLYVLGKVNGEVEIKDKESKLYCEFIEESLVKIGDIYKYYNEPLFSKELFLLDDEIKERDYKKGEINNVKSNSCYLG